MIESVPTNELVGHMPDPNGEPIPFSEIRSPAGDVDGLSFGSGPFALDRATFDRVVWPLMSDMNRAQFTNHGACAIYR